MKWLDNRDAWFAVVQMFWFNLSGAVYIISFVVHLVSACICYENILSMFDDA